MTTAEVPDRARELYLDLSALAPREIVDVYRLAVDWQDAHDLPPLPPSLEESANASLLDRLESTLSDLPELEPERYIEIYNAFADSPLLQDRLQMASTYLWTLTEANHDAGVVLWDRLLRDVDKSVRDKAMGTLDILLPCYFEGDATKRGGMYMLDTINDDELHENSGLTRIDVYNLLESYAYAENGMFLHDLGQVALRKLVTANLPTA